MIVLTVLSYSGVPAEGLSARFDELGGTIGRADNNQLVLPDPERSISRLHAKVVFRGGQYAIVDNGSNPIGVNDAAVPAGREQIIRPGDQVQIGSYLLVVTAAAVAGATANPFADLFGDGAQGLAGPVSAPPPASAWASPPMVSATAARPDHGAAAASAAMPPMRATGSPAPAPASWGAAWPAPAAASPSPYAAVAPAASAPAGSAASLLADDWDFLAADPKLGPAAAPGFPSAAAGGGGLGLALGPGAVDSLDDLFGLSKTPAGGDPLGAAPAQALLMQPNMAAHADPLQALSRPAQDLGASWADHGSDLNTPMPLPKPVAAAPAPSPPAAPISTGTGTGTGTGTAASGLPSGAIFSWDDPPRDGRVVTLPGMARSSAPARHPGAPAGPVAAPAPAGQEALRGPLDDPMFGALFDPPVNPVLSARPAPLIDPTADPMADLLAGAGGLADRDLAAVVMPGPPAAPVPPPAPAYRAPATPAARPSASVAAPPRANGPDGDPTLLAALSQGLGVPGLRLDALTPELMLLIGQLLRESTRGAVELLVARAALKREMRAEMTMIVARENNPLKFSPSVEVALQHLLAPTSPGFMPAARAVRDAFDDLRAHQLGVMAGMKAALDGVLQRFDPQQLEAKLSTRSAIDSILPATRKARLWESFQQLFSQLSSEAQDDFDELFGKAFLRAYEAQLDRLQAEPGPR